MLLVVRAETCGLAGDRILIRKIINSSLNDVCLSRFFPPSSTDESHRDVVAVCLNRHHAQCLRNLCVSSPQWKIVAPSSQFINVKPLQLPASLPHTHTHTPCLPLNATAARRPHRPECIFYLKWYNKAFWSTACYFVLAQRSAQVLIRHARIDWMDKWYAIPSQLHHFSVQNKAKLEKTAKHHRKTNRINSQIQYAGIKVIEDDSLCLGLGLGHHRPSWMR